MMWRCSYWPFLLLACAPWALASAPASAQAARKVAVFPLLVKGKVDFAAVKEIQTLLSSGVSDSELVTVAGPTLRKRIRQPPRRAMARCERVRNFANCVGKLAVLANASEVLVGRATAAGGGMKVVILAIKPNRTVERRATLVIPGGGSVEEYATPEWLAKALDADLVQPAPAPPLLVAHKGTGNRHMPETSAAPETPETPETEIEIVARILADLPAMPADLLPSSVLAAEQMAEPAVVRATGLGLDAPGFPMDLAEPAPAWRPTLRWSGVALGAAGAAAVAWGGYLGLAVEEANSRLNAGSGVTQVGAKSLAHNAASDATAANILFGAGVGAITVGLSLFITELFLD